jgi:S-disulfanyl-L-cysteine oxidoreductase SoxD
MIGLGTARCVTAAAAAAALFAAALGASMAAPASADAQAPPPPPPPAAAPPTSVRDGVFNAEQVERGRTAYNAQCARCHGETLGGGETSPALVDERFFQVWAGRTVGQLVEYTRTTMPSDGPGRISRKRCIDIAAYVLSVNGVPAGARELPTQLDALDQIAITRAK